MLRCGVLWDRKIGKSFQKKIKTFFRMEPTVVPIYLNDQQLPPTVYGEVTYDVEAHDWRLTDKHVSTLDPLIRAFISEHYSIPPGHSIQRRAGPIHERITYEFVPLRIRAPPRSGGNRKTKNKTKHRKKKTKKMRKTKRRTT